MSDHDDTEERGPGDIRPMPVPHDPSSHRSNIIVNEPGAGTTYVSGAKPMPRPKRPRPLTPIHHQS